MTTPELDPLQSLEAGLANVADAAGLVVLSDLDHTLSHEYVYCDVANSLLPDLSPELIEAASDHTLIIATGRRAENPAIPHLWTTGLVDDNLPIIAENGGTLIFNDDGALDFVDLIQPEDITGIDDVCCSAVDMLASQLPDDLELIVKNGRTMRILKIRDQDGSGNPEHQAWLANQLQEMIAETHPHLTAVDSGDSVVLQHHSVSKGAAFMRYLEIMGQDLDDLTVIGMGNAANDASIFALSHLNIGFDRNVADQVDVLVVEGAQAAPMVLRAIATNLPLGAR